MITAPRLIKILTSTSEEIHRSEFLWIIKKLYGVDYKEAEAILTREFDKLLEEQDK